MSHPVYSAGCIVRNLVEHFLPHRGLALCPRAHPAPGAARRPAEDDVISDMEQFFCVRLDAVRTAGARGARDRVVVLVLSGAGKYAHFSPDLRRLLEGVDSERFVRDGRLDELLVVAEEPFFAKKNLTDVIQDLQKRQAGGADRAGAAPFYSAVPYHVFACVIPESSIVPPHRVMSDAEVAALLERERLALRELPVIFASDPPVIWNGGREGEVVEITRDSMTSGTALYWRRVEKGRA